MTAINENFQKLPGSYLFSEIARRVAAYEQEHPDKKLIRLGIGDVTRPLPEAVTAAMHRAEDILIGQDWVLAPIYFYTYKFMLNDNIQGLYYKPTGQVFFKYCTQKG